MNNLIPEVRVNKNGVPVTKHVRPDTGKGTGSTLPPLVKFTEPKKKAATVEDIVDLLREKNPLVALSKSSRDLLSELPKETREKALALINEWPEKSLEGLNELFSSGLKNRDVFEICVTIAQDVHKMYSPDDEGNVIGHILAACKKHGITRMDTDPTDYHFGLIKAEIIAQGLYLDSDFRYLIPHQQSMFVEDIRRNLEVIEPAATVIAAIGSLTGMDDAGQDFDEVLWTAEFVNRFPGQATKIANIVLDRGEFNTEVIEQVLSSESPAVSEGIL